LARVRETCLGAYAHPDLPFEKLVEELQPERTLGQNPVFQVSFVLQNATAGADFTFVTVASPFDLSCSFARSGRDVERESQYRRDLFERATITRLAVHYLTLLESIVAEPDGRISSLRLLTSRATSCCRVNATTTPISRSVVNDLFEDQADASPDATALVFEGTELTYRELDRRANRLAHHLRAAGVGSESPVGVLMDRSIETIVVLLGILKAAAPMFRSTWRRRRNAWPSCCSIRASPSSSPRRRCGAGSRRSRAARSVSMPTGILSRQRPDTRLTSQVNAPIWRTSYTRPAPRVSPRGSRRRTEASSGW